jgi:uncharacterized RDD family membrane protein YckC
MVAGSGFSPAAQVHRSAVLSSRVLPSIRRSAPVGRTAAGDSFMKPRFKPDAQSGEDDALSPTLIDPEAFDASEQRFAASLEQDASSRPPRFVVQPETPTGLQENAGENRLPEAWREEQARAADEPTSEQVKLPVAEVPVPGDPESWRREVAARLSHYRARRRPREPRYPSLQLRFETEPAGSDSLAEPAALDLPASANSARGDQKLGPVTPPVVGSMPRASGPRIRLAEPADYPPTRFSATSEATAKVIEFASYAAPPRPFDELAEPVLERPRIIEAPELAPPPPALGGISIEPVEEAANDRRPGFEIPLQAAAMGRRLVAAGTDALLVGASIAAFAYIFFRITSAVPPPAKVAGTAFFLAGLFWSAYQYLLLVYSGGTPGLRLARLELQRFDGDPVPRRLRQWRVLASVLSGVSLGLGYAWCLLDEDELCWHDRITRTYMAPKK